MISYNGVYRWKLFFLSKQFNWKMAGVQRGRRPVPMNTPGGCTLQQPFCAPPPCCPGTCLPQGLAGAGPLPPELSSCPCSSPVSLLPVPSASARCDLRDVFPEVPAPWGVASSHCLPPATGLTSLWVISPCWYAPPENRELQAGVRCSPVSGCLPCVGAVGTGSQDS